MGFEFLGLAQESNGINMETYQQFHQLFENRTILLNWEVNESLLENVILPLKDFEADDIDEPVTLILNTPGGSVADGLVLCNIIDNYKKRLNIFVYGYSCSMGTIILCSGNKNPNVTKYCYPFSFGLFHSGETVVGGESTSVDDIIDFNRSINNSIQNYVVANTNITEAEYKLHHRKQWYLTAKEMKEKGLIDIIIGEE
jgi:ATP-dependent Clp protease protease subunit